MEAETDFESEDEWKMEATVSDKLLSHVHKLENEFKVSEQKRMELIEANMALQNILRTRQDEECRTLQEIDSLIKQRQLSALTLKVRWMEHVGLEASD